MARNVRRGGWLGVGFTVAVLAVVVVVVVWQSLAQSTNPHYQSRHSQGGVGEYYVNLWLDPHPPGTGPVQLTAQLTTIIGTPIDLAYLVFEVAPADAGQATEIQGEYRVNGAGREDVYVASTDFDRVGPWNVTVRYSFGGPETRVSFEIDVAD
jgi:hypothetical protein